MKWGKGGVLRHDKEKGLWDFWVKEIYPSTQSMNKKSVLTQNSDYYLKCM